MDKVDIVGEVARKKVAKTARLRKTKNAMFYAAGVISTPLWYAAFYRQINQKLAPMLLDWLSNEELDEALFTIMQARLTHRENKKKGMA